MTIALQPADEAPTDDAVTLRYEVAGRLDADSFREVQKVEREPEPDSVVVIDLRQCSGMDDFGFGSLVGLIRRAREQHARVQVRGAAGAVRESLRRSGVARLVDLMPTDRTPGERLAGEGVRSR
jgi:anti-anti-sigma regulatory factor